jgi:hypothetical protein
LSGVRTSIEAEYNLHATILAIRLVDQFVTEHRRWPSSWDELEGQSLAEDLQGGMYRWPDSSQEIRTRVILDFAADPREIAAQDSMTFAAIKPVGPCYEYRHYVPSLQASVRKSLASEN